jgi:VanZ family protein
LKAWLLVSSYTLVIFFSIPFVREIQTFVYRTAGRIFFAYSVISVVCCVLAILLYFFVIKLKVKKISQYIWLFIGAGLYIYFTFRLRKMPEESTHLIEYGLLSYFVFKALSHRVHDWTVYITTVLIVSLVGIMDEFLQWMMPGRYWDFRDIGTNIIGGLILQLTIWKGIRPDFIKKPLSKISVKVFMAVFSIDLIFLGICLSNTPKAVNSYTAVFKSLLWLRAEEPMSEFAYLKAAWILILALLIAVWISGAKLIKRIK